MKTFICDVPGVGLAVINADDMEKAHTALEKYERDPNLSFRLGFIKELPQEKGVVAYFSN